MSRKGEPSWTDTSDPKDIAIMAKPFECSIEGIERVFSKNVLPGDITKVEEGVEGPDDVGRHVMFKGSNEDLQQVSMYK